MTWINFDWELPEDAEEGEDRDLVQEEGKLLELGWLYEPDYDEFPSCFCQAIRITHGERVMILDCRYTYLTADNRVAFGAETFSAFGLSKQEAVEEWLRNRALLDSVAAKRTKDSRLLLETLNQQKD